MDYTLSREWNCLLRLPENIKETDPDGWNDVLREFARAYSATYDFQITYGIRVKRLVRADGSCHTFRTCIGENNQCPFTSDDDHATCSVHRNTSSSWYYAGVRWYYRRVDTGFETNTRYKLSKICMVKKCRNDVLDPTYSYCTDHQKKQLALKRQRGW